MSAIRRALDQLAAVGKREVNLLESKQAVSGAFNQTTFATIGDAKVAISQSKNSTPQINVQRANAVQALLRQKEVDTRFLQTFISYQTDGTKLSLLASGGSLQTLIDSSTVSREQIKTIFGQVVLGVLALHEKALAHRDIHPSNILIFPIKQNDFYVQLADLDTVIELYPKDGTVCDKRSFTLGGASLPSPELLALIDIERHQWKTAAMSIYPTLDLKAVDCFALGVVLDKLIAKVKPNDIFDNNPEYDLRDALMEKDPTKRLTILGVLKHAFFNAQTNDTTQTLKEDLPLFFQSLYAKVPERLIDGDSARAASANDSYFLIEPAFKPVYRLVEHLENQFQFFDDFKENVGDTAYTALTQTFTKCMTEMDNVKEPSDQQQSALLRLKFELVVKMADIQFKLKKKLDVSALRFIVDFSVREYIEQNQFNQPKSGLASWLSRNGEAEKQRATCLKDEINKAVNNNQSADHVFNIICQFITSPQNENMLPTSFKRILAGNIAKLTNLFSDETNKKRHSA